MNDFDLKPCPFCGMHPKIVIIDAVIYQVRCGNPVSYAFQKEHDGDPYRDSVTAYCPQCGAKMDGDD